MKALITGVTGFVGSHMAELLLKKNVEVYAISEVRPDVIYHLAAQSYVPASFRLPADTLHVNIIGTCNLLEAVRLNKQTPLIHICSSSEVYGQVRPDEVPIKETNPLRPVSPYGISKAGEDFLGQQYYISYGMKTLITRMFSHTGPRRGDVFVASSFAKQIAEIEKGVEKEHVIHVGNLDSVRTFADVRDAVRAYWLLTEKCKPGEVYNIGGTETMTIREMMQKLLKISGHDDIVAKQDPSLMRPSDVTLQIPDNTKFFKATGWKPEIPFEQTLKDLLNYWRERV